MVPDHFPFRLFIVIKQEVAFHPCGDGRAVEAELKVVDLDKISPRLDVFPQEPVVFRPGAQPGRERRLFACEFGK